MKTTSIPTAVKSSSLSKEEISKLSKKNQAIIAAAEKGYTADDDGVIYRPDGSVQKFCQNDGYHRFQACGAAILAHRFVMFTREGDCLFNPDTQVDHRNRVRTDNSIGNLHLVTHSGNMVNRPNRGNSQYRGVGWHTRNSRWIARIKIDGKLQHLGYFTDEIEAAKAFDRYVIDNGLNRILNFPT